MMDAFEAYLFDCPYCGSSNSLQYDVSGGERQRLIQDCEICCQPIVIMIRSDHRGLKDVQIIREND